MLSAPASGQGKTTVTAALANYHKRQGRQVRAFKTGPDFIDPSYLAAASGHPVYQLDTWMVGVYGCRALLYEAAAHADVILVEGVMGLFDGEPSSADLAQQFGLPILAIIDAQAMAQSFGALALGLKVYRQDLRFAGVLANRVAGPGHAEMLRASLPDDISWWGYLGNDDTHAVHERHLGLMQAEEQEQLDRLLQSWSNGLILPEEGQASAKVDFVSARESVVPSLLAGVRIGVARDAAFSFLYPANIDVLERMGAELIFFSPLSDTALPSVDSVYLPGGYPELYLSELSANTGVATSLRNHAEAAKPLFAECGGMLYLLEELEDRDGHAGRLCGLLPGRGRMQAALSAIGYQQAEFSHGSLRGHTFHHSLMETACEPVGFGFSPTGVRGEAVYQLQRITASYMHFYFPSNPHAIAALLHP